MKDTLGEIISIQKNPQFLVKLAEYWANYNCKEGSQCKTCPLNKPTTLFEKGSDRPQTICECLMEIHCEAFTNSTTQEHLYEELDIDPIIKEVK